MRTHTIGEVLNELKGEFEDVTISKIRFLESEGLISPDRTDSGYRQFTDNDIERLRYVLRAQRDRYLPLRVIRDELERIDAGLPVQEAPATPSPEEVDAVRGDTPAVAPADADPRASVLEAGPGETRLSVAELCDATGLEHRDVAGLREHGLLGDREAYDGDDLRVARAAAALMDLGLEPRHLKMYRQFADREYALYEQLVSPLLRRRNPDSRKAAAEQAAELTEQGAELHRATLVRELRHLLGP